MNEKLGPSAPAGQDLSPPTTRVVDIVELLLQRPTEPPTLAEICRELDVSRSTGHAIMHTLCARQWVSRDPLSGRFSLGPALSGLGGPDGMPSRSLREPLQRMCASLGMPMCISALHDRTIVVVESAAAPGTRAPVPAGVRLPFVAPFGREFVAWAPVSERADWLAATGSVNQAFRRRISQVLDEIRVRGYGVERLSDPLLQVFTALKALDNGSPPGPLSTRLAAAVADLTVVDQLATDEPDATPLATISAPIFDDTGTVVMTVSAQPYRTLNPQELEAVGAGVVTFARDVETLCRSTEHRQPAPVIRS
ncbi:helix-turn-helix domain-containing protein [Mycobacterium sp. 134]|uniref:helix-turn-helix domain-containing protein n=1 Tax=Mycobacterium sp. 134 TaxID=3400425 RepID=UPI003AADDCCD